MNPADADTRGLKEGDIVRLFNDTGHILCHLHLTERMVQGVVWVPWGAWYNPIIPGDNDSVDKGGCCNTLVSRWSDADGVQYDVGNPAGGYPVGYVGPNNKAGDTGQVWHIRRRTHEFTIRLRQPRAFYTRADGEMDGGIER